MRSVIRQAKTVDQAVKEALLILNVSKEEAKIEVIEEPQSSFLGIFGGKDAIVKVSVEDDSVEKLINEVFYDEEDEKDSKAGEDRSKEEGPSKEGLKANTGEESTRKAPQPDKHEDQDKASRVESSQGPRLDDLEDKDEGLDEEVPSPSKDSPGQGPGGDGQSKIDKKDPDPKSPGPSDKDQGLEDDREDPADLNLYTRASKEGKEASQVLLEDMLEAMDIDGRVLVEKADDEIKLEIVDTSSRDTAIVIGRRGDTINSIQYLLNLVENKKSSDYIRVSLDISNYRDKRKESLKRFARRMADKALRENRNIKLDHMNAYERKIVHSCLADTKGIRTESEGQGQNRRLVIKIDK